MIWLAMLIGVFMVGLGLIGLTVPEVLFRTARAAQELPWLHVAALVRIAIGVVLYIVAPRSRMPIGMAVIAVILFTAGILTPFTGAGAAQLILDLWNTAGPIIVRAFSVLAMAMGLLILYAVTPTTPRRRKSDQADLPIRAAHKP